MIKTDYEIVSWMIAAFLRHRWYKSQENEKEKFFFTKRVYIIQKKRTTKMWNKWKKKKETLKFRCSCYFARKQWYWKLSSQSMQDGTRRDVSFFWVLGDSVLEYLLRSFYFSQSVSVQLAFSFFSYILMFFSLNKTEKLSEYIFVLKYIKRLLSLIFWNFYWLNINLNF